MRDQNEILIKKSELNNKFEMENLEEKFVELENLDDLWYFVKSSSASWVVGSAK